VCRHGRAIVELLLRLHETGLTILIVSHDPQIAAVCPRVVEIRDGQVGDPRFAGARADR
jgi:putative ABC transport system ATP-binding protein